MPRRTRLLSSLLLLAVLLGVPVLLTWRAVRQARLDKALLTAILYNDVPTTLDLLKQGANPNARLTSSPVASWQQIMMKWFHRQSIQRAEDQSILESVIRINIVEVASVHFDNSLLVKALLDGGADPNQPDADGNALLLDALTYDDPPTIPSMLIKYGANVNVCDPQSNTPLILASEKENIPIGTIKLLLNKGAAVNARNKYGYSAIWQAAYVGRVDVVKLLLRYNADVKAEDVSGETILAYVKDRNSSLPNGIVSLLKQAGAKE